MNREQLADQRYVKGDGGRLRHRVPGLKHLEGLLKGHMTIAPEELPWFAGQIAALRQRHIERLAKKGRVYA